MLVIVLNRVKGGREGPGPGWNDRFFKDCWNLVEKDVTRSKTSFGSELNSPFGDPATYLFFRLHQPVAEGHIDCPTDSGTREGSTHVVEPDRMRDNGK